MPRVCRHLRSREHTQRLVLDVTIPDWSAEGPPSVEQPGIDVDRLEQGVEVSADSRVDYVINVRGDGQIPENSLSYCRVSSWAMVSEPVGSYTTSCTNCTVERGPTCDTHFDPAPGIVEPMVYALRGGVGQIPLPSYKGTDEHPPCTGHVETYAVTEIGSRIFVPTSKGETTANLFPDLFVESWPSV